MSQTLSLTPSADPLGLLALFRGSPIILTGTAISGMTAYRAQLWTRPQDVLDSDIEALAIANGSVSSGSAFMAFTASQMDLTLTADAGAYDDIWLSITALQADGQRAVLRAGWVRVVEAGFDPDAAGTTSTEIVVQDDVAYFSYGGVDYALPVVPIETPSGATEGEITVIDDTMIITVGGQSYTAPVVPTDDAPTEIGSTDPILRGAFQVGSDGATYALIETPTGQRWVPTYASLP